MSEWMIFGIFVVAVGGVVAVVGLAALYVGIAQLRIEHLVGKPTLPVRTAMSCHTAHLLGRVSTSDADSAMRAPATGRDVVWCRTRVERSGYKGARHVVWSQTRSRRFELVDEAGDRALIEPEDAVVLVDEHRVDASAEAEFLRSRWSGEAGLRVVEELLAIGDQLHAIGPLTRCDDGRGALPYRDADRGAALVKMQRKRGAKLILTTSDDAAPKVVGGAQSGGMALAVGIACCAVAPFIFSAAPIFAGPPPSRPAAAHSTTIGVPASPPNPIPITAADVPPPREVRGVRRATHLAAVGDGFCAWSDEEAWCFRESREVRAERRLIGAKAAVGDPGTFMCTLGADGHVSCGSASAPLGTAEFRPTGSYTAISLGAIGLCVVDAAERAGCWATKDVLRSFTERAAPPAPLARIGGISHAIAITNDAENGVLLVLLSDGTVNEWSPEKGVLPSPAAANVIAVGAAGRTRCFFDRSLKLQCSGLSLVTRDATARSAELTAIEDAGGVTQLAVAEEFACARLDDGTVRCWGSNAHGELGDGTRKDRLSAGPVLGISGAREVRVLDDRACALLEDGRVQCWGEAQ